MKPFYMLHSEASAERLRRFDDIDAARAEAKRTVNRDRGNTADIFILKAVERVRQPVPDAEVEVLGD